MNKPVIVSDETLTEPVVVEPASLKATAAAGPTYVVLVGISFSHFLNDTMQSLIASVYPILKDSYALDFAQIGLITLAFQFTASLLQPLVGHFTDKRRNRSRWRSACHRPSSVFCSVSPINIRSS